MEIFSGRARNLSTDGSAVVEAADGRIFFVPGAWPGDEGRFEVVSFEKRYGYARLVELEKRSEERAEVPCVHQGFGAGSCGGCPWMIGTYTSQLKYKAHRAAYALERAGLLGGVHVATLNPIWASPEPFAYRNRAQFKSDGERLGFVALGTTELVDVRACAVLNPRMRETLAGLRAALPRAEWRPARGHEWIFLDIDDELDLRAADAVVVNRRRPFKQGNAAQNDRMRDWLAEKLAAQPARAALELYCGSGNFTRVLIEAGTPRVTGVEVAEAALVQLRERASGWGAPAGALDTIAFNLANPRDFRAFVPVLRSRGREQADLLVLDPPREGAKGVELLVQAMPALERVLMISCDVATFTRDAAAIAKLGFRLAEAQPLDLFPHTAHVELLAEFMRSPR